MMSFIFTCEIGHGCGPLSKGQIQQRRSLGCTCDDLCEWTTFETCRIAASRSIWARLAGRNQRRTESYVRTPSIAVSGQDHLPAFGQDLPGRVKTQGQKPMKRERTTSWPVAERMLNFRGGKVTDKLVISRALRSTNSRKRGCGKGSDRNGQSRFLRLPHSGHLLQMLWWNTCAKVSYADDREQARHQ